MSRNKRKTKKVETLGKTPVTEAVLLHDVSGSHPRLKYFNEMVAEVARRSNGTLTISMNPGGAVLFPGKASIDAVRSGRASLALVNNANLQMIDPRLGFTSLPFTLCDQIMLKPSVADEIIRMMQPYVKPSGLQLMGLRRGADTILVSKKHQIHKPEDLKGMKIRVAASGLYQEVVRSFGAEPVVLPPTEINSAIERGVVDGVFTSPGGWVSIGLGAPNGSLVPGLMFYTGSLIADKTWLDGLSVEQRQALVDASRTSLTDKWRDMQQEDSHVISTFVDQGASYWSVPEDELAPWKERVEWVTRQFADRYSEVIQRYRSVVQSGIE